MKAKQLNEMTKAQLLDMARKKKLKVTTKMSKGEMTKLLMRGEKKSAAAAKGRTVKAAAKKALAKAAARKKKKPVKKPAAAKSAVAKAKRAAKKAIAAKRAGKKVKTRKPTASKKRVAAEAREPGAPKKKEAAKVRKPAAREKRIEAETIRQKAEIGKYYLGAEEQVMPPVEAMEIPAGYDIDRIVAMVRDPHWIFSYWEITEERYRELEEAFGREWPDCKMVLRVFDRTTEPHTHFDIEIVGGARNWYIHVSPERRYQIAIGAMGPGGKFVEAALSNVVETPPEGASNVIDDRWLIPDDMFARIFAESGGYGFLAGSLELRELMERRLLEQISSPAISSISSPARREELGRKFRLWVATELILYGATDPDAQLTVQGKEVKLRGDGTFSMRFALPDGTIDLPVTACSADGVEERTVKTVVNKKTRKKEPVLR